MKHVFTKFFALTLLMVTSKAAFGFGYDRVNVTNNTNYPISVDALYAGCNGDRWLIQPHKSAEAPNSRGFCLLTDLKANVDKGSSNWVAAEQYSSSGTSYSQFRVEPNGDGFKVVRS